MTGGGNGLGMRLVCTYVSVTLIFTFAAHSTGSPNGCQASSVHVPPQCYIKLPIRTAITT